MLRKTGDEAIGAGVYHSDCHCRHEIQVRVGEKFPLCPRCKAGVFWMFTRFVQRYGPGRGTLARPASSTGPDPAAPSPSDKGTCDDEASSGTSGESSDA